MWFAYLVGAAIAMTAVRELGGLAIRVHQPPYHYTLCYFGMAFCGLFGLTMSLKAFTNLWHWL